MRIKRFSWIFLYCFAAVLPSIVYATNAISNGSNNFIYLLSGILGITSYSMFAFQFLLTSRPKLIDKYFGLDRIYRFHIVIAVIAIILGITHNQLKEYLQYGDSLQTSLGSASLIIFIAISVLSILLMINRLFFKVNILDSIRKYLNNTLKLKYETKVLYHNLTIAALIILLLHILLAGSVRFNKPLQIIMIIYFVIPLTMYINHKIIKVYFYNDKRYFISNIINESSNVVTLKLTPENGKFLDYLPGQFIYLRISNPEIPGDEHPFTLSSSPTEKEYISVTIKQIGDFTNSLKKAKKGDKAYVDGGFGTFSYLRKPQAKKLCFIAGGIGITPFLGMLRYMAEMNKNREVVLLWGVRSISELICKDELNKYTDLLKNFKFIPIVSDEKDFAGEKGFIDKEKIKNYTETPLEYDFFICGPPAMMDIELHNLKKLGVPKSSIHFERFSM